MQWWLFSNIFLAYKKDARYKIFLYIVRNYTIMVFILSNDQQLLEKIKWSATEHVNIHSLHACALNKLVCFIWLLMYMPIHFKIDTFCTRPMYQLFKLSFVRHFTDKHSGSISLTRNGKVYFLSIQLFSWHVNLVLEMPC